MNIFQLSLQLILLFFDAVSLFFSTFLNKPFARRIYFKSVTWHDSEIYIYMKRTPVSRIYPYPGYPEPVSECSPCSSLEHTPIVGCTTWPIWENRKNPFKELQKKVEKSAKIKFYKKNRGTLGKLIISNMMFLDGFGRIWAF